MQNTMNYIKLIVGGITTVITYLLGGFDMALIVLLIFISMDYLTGVLCGIVNKQLSSEIGFKGLLKKVLILCIVAVAHLVGRVTGIEGVRSFVIGFYLANEAISILENIGNLGVPLPSKLISILEQIKDRD